METVVPEHWLQVIPNGAILGEALQEAAHPAEVDAPLSLSKLLLGCVLSSSHLDLPVLLCQAISEQIFGKRGPHSSNMNQLMLKRELFK